MAPRQFLAEIAPPGVAEDKDLRLAQVLPKPLDHLVDIVVEALRGHGRRYGLGIVIEIGAALAALVPFDDREILFPFMGVPPGQRRLDIAGTAVQDPAAHRMRRSRPRIVTYWSRPPIRTIRASSMPLGVTIFRKPRMTSVRLRPVARPRRRSGLRRRGRGEADAG